MGRMARWLGRNWALVSLALALALCLLVFLGWVGGGEAYQSSEYLLGGWGVGPGDLGLFKGDGYCLGPTAFAPLPDGGVLVADAWNSRLLRFDREGRLVPGSSWPGPASSPQVASASGLAAAPPMGAAAPSGLLSAPPPAPGASPSPPADGQPARPRSPVLGLAVDKRQVFLAEGDRRRVQVFSLDGRLLRTLEPPADPAIPAETGSWALEDLWASGGQVFYCEQVTGSDGHRRRLWRLDRDEKWELQAETVLSPEGRVTLGGRLAASWNSMALDAEGRLGLEGPADSRQVRRVAVFDAQGLCREGELSVPGVADVIQLVGVDGRGCPFLQVESPPGHLRLLRYPPLGLPAEDDVPAASPQFAWTSAPGVADLGARARLGPRGALYVVEARPDGYALRVMRWVRYWRWGWRGWARARTLAPP